MQERQKNRALYFQELAETGRKHFLPYISNFKEILPGMNILEIGCGEGGILLPFAEKGCSVTGVDLAEGKIANAKRFFAELNMSGTFIASDIFKLKELENSFDLIICHDVIEHIGNKDMFLHNLRKYLTPSGIIFMAFPAWQMPFGGHQQICRNKMLSHLPFFHLLPAGLYRAVLKAGNEDPVRIDELMEIKETGLSIETFEKLARNEGIVIKDRTLYFINPHYETKFGLRPRKLYGFISCLPRIRNFFTTSCFYILEF